MRAKKALFALGLALASSASACSFYDFFGYQDDTGLFAIEKPKGYPSADFGAKIAPTSTPEADFVAIGAGGGYPVMIYKVAENGDLKDAVNPWDEYLSDDVIEADTRFTGSDLASLPIWGNVPETGCIAIGEPNVSEVRIDCDKSDTVVGVPADIPAAKTERTEGFGRFLSEIRPAGAGAWLLAVGTNDSFVVLSSKEAGDHTDLATPLDGSGSPAGELTEIAAGRLDSGRFFVAAATLGKLNARNRVYLFVQDSPGGKTMVQSGCIERKDEPGFGGSMIAGDLDGDKTDELIVSASLDEYRVDAVYVYDVSKIVEDGTAAAPNCIGDGAELSATVLPQKGELDVECLEGCGFGAALSLGDIATDDKGPELCIGAPGAKADGQEEGGAVYIYRGSELVKGRISLAGQVTDSWQDGKNRFGAGLAVAPMAGRNELMIGATGKNGEVFIAFCTGVGMEPKDLNKGADVPCNANGSIISTRCRP